MRTAAAALLLPLFTATASAQPSVVEQEAPPPAAANETTATLLSAGGAVLGIATIYLGAHMHDGDTPMMELGGAIALVGPSAGEWYARGGAYFTPGLGIRLAGVALMGIGFGSALDRGCDATSNTCNAPIRDTTSDGVIAAGAAIAVAGMVWDIATAGHETHKANARRLAVDPVVMPTANRGMATGIGLSGAF